MKFSQSVQAAAAVSGFTLPKSLNVSSPNSIRDVAATIAYDTLSFYNGNSSAPNSTLPGDLPKPYYWWVGGALWGALLDYYHYTGDPSYNGVILQALIDYTNLGSKFDYVPYEHRLEEGNDDLFFWGSAALTAAERNFPQPNSTAPSWIDISDNVFESLVSRWNAQQCGGGLFWQMYADNPNGLKYKNSVSNGGLFQLAARLHRATGKPKYRDWAAKVWDWSSSVGFFDTKDNRVYDGAHIGDNCTEINRLSFTYTTGIYMYGAAVLANSTGDKEWQSRAERMLNGAGNFFSTEDDSKNVMIERACEPVGTCNKDMETFKGFLSRSMWQTAAMLPALRPKIESYLLPSAKAAAAACSGGSSGRRCGMKWYTGGFDKNMGLGQQMSALETIQGLLSQAAAAPLKGDDIKLVREVQWAALERKPEATATESTSTEGTATATTTAASASASEDSGATYAPTAGHFGSILLLLGLSAAMAV